MDDQLPFTWLAPGDRRVIAELGSEFCPVLTFDRVRESALIRIAVAMLAPLWVGLSALITLRRVATNRRPLIVLHERVGLHRRRLWVPKLATMQVNGNRRLLAGLIEVATGAPIEGEVRGRGDRWIRECGFDEIPQLALVAAGSMRLVGPRPVTPAEFEVMARDAYAAVDRVAPGLLGVWQLLDRDAYTLEQRCMLDDWMLDRWSPGLRRRVVAIGVGQAFGRITGWRGKSGSAVDPDSYSE